MAADIERLVPLVYPSCPAEMRETLACERLVDSIDDPDCQHAVIMASFKNLRDAVM